MRLRTTAMLLAVLGPSSAAAEIYRWVDEQGRVHFGDRPRDSVAETVELPDRPAVDGPAGGEQAPARDPDRLQRWLRAKDQERADRQRDERLQLRERRRRLANCGKARHNWDYYHQGGVFYETREDGRRHFLDEAELADRISAIRRAVRRYCREDPAAGASRKK